HPMLSPSLTQRWRPAAFLHCLQTLVASCTKHRPIESRWIRPDLPQWETVTDLLARQHTHLYIHSLLGKEQRGRHDALTSLLSTFFLPVLLQLRRLYPGTAGDSTDASW